MNIKVALDEFCKIAELKKDYILKKFDRLGNDVLISSKIFNEKIYYCFSDKENIKIDKNVFEEIKKKYNENIALKLSLLKITENHKNAIIEFENTIKNMKYKIENIMISSFEIKLDENVKKIQSLENILNIKIKKMENQYIKLSSHNNFILEKYNDIVWYLEEFAKQTQKAEEKLIIEKEKYKKLKIHLIYFILIAVILTIKIFSFK